MNTNECSEYHLSTILLKPSCLFRNFYSCLFYSNILSLLWVFTEGKEKAKLAKIRIKDIIIITTVLLYP